MRMPVEFREYPPTLADMAPWPPRRAVVMHHIDGDTFDVLIDLGFNEYRYMAIRLLDVDAPEINRLWTRVAGQAALAHLRSLIPVDSPVVLIARTDEQSFGRYVCEVWATSPLGTFSVNESMRAYLGA